MFTNSILAWSLLCRHFISIFTFDCLNWRLSYLRDRMLRWMDNIYSYDICKSIIHLCAFLFFQKEETASLAIKMIYFVIGLIAPLTIAILQLVARKYYDIANIIRWVFYPFPIFSMTFGYMSICNR